MCFSLKLVLFCTFSGIYTLPIETFFPNCGLEEVNEIERICSTHMKQHHLKKMQKVCYEEEWWLLVSMSCAIRRERAALFFLLFIIVYIYHLRSKTQEKELYSVWFLLLPQMLPCR